MKDKLTAFLLAVLMVAQVIAPQAAWASGNNFNLEKKQDLVKIGELDTKSYPKLDNKTILSIQKQAREKQKTQKRKPGAGFFSKDNPYLPGQNPTDEEKAAAYGRIRVLFETEGLNDNGALKDFQWREIFGEDSNGNLTNAKIHFIQRDAKTNKELGRYTLNVNQAGEYKWTDTFGKVALLPLYSNALEPYKYDASLEYQISDKVKLLAMEIGTTNEKISFTEEGDKNVADIPLKLKLGQVASTKFESEWKTSLDENSRPQVEGLFNTKNKDQDNYDIENLIAFPKNNTDSIKLRNDNVDPNNPPDLPYDQSPGLSFRNVPEVKVVEGLEFADENDLVGTPTYHLDEANKTITTLDGAHKFKYDFTYDVINGGKLTMTEILPVTFDANGGKFATFTAPDTETKIVKEVEYGKDLTDKAEEPTKDRETFKGWSTTQDGKNPVTDQDLKNITKAKTFYAIWDNNEITADQLEVKESFKDGDTWVNDFIPDLATLKAQVKIKDANGDLQALTDDDTLQILDDSGNVIADANLKDKLYEKLKEEDTTEVSRDVTLKAKVNLKNGTSKEVNIPIKVVKNIYEAKTETKPPYYVPKDYVKVTLDPTNKAQDPQKTYYYVNPDAKVVIPGKDPVGTGDNQFTKWLIDGTTEEYKLADKPRHQFKNETTIKAQYVSDVIPGNPDGSKPDTVPENYVKVDFTLLPEIGGKIADDATTVYYVNPDKEVTIPQPKTIADTGYEFEKWDQDTTTPNKYANNTTVKGSFKRLDNIIPATNDDGTSNNQPEGYVTVTFTDGVEGKVHGKITSGKTVYYVNPKAKKQLKHLVLDSYNRKNRPIVTPDVGYKFTGWLQGNNYDIVRDVTVPAEYKPIDAVIPKTKNDESEKPKDYVTVKLIPTNKATDATEKIYFVNPTKSVTITNKPVGTKVTDANGITYDYTFTGWTVTKGTITSWTGANITGKFSQDTDITAQYKTNVDPGIILAAPVPKKNAVTPINDKPNPEDLIDNPFDPNNPTNKDNLPKGTKITYEKEPDVKNPGDTKAKVKVEYPNGKTTIVEVPITVVDNVVPQDGGEDGKKPLVPDNYVKVTVDTTDAATPNTKFKKVFWVKPDVEVTIPDISAPTGKEETIDGVKKINKFVEWKLVSSDPAKTYKEGITDTFTAKDNTIVATYEYDKNVEPKGKDNPWIPQGSNPSPKDFIENPYDDNDPNNPNNLPPGTRFEFVPGTEPNTSEPGEGKTTTIKVTYPNGEVKEVPVTFRVTGDVVEQPDPNDEGTKPAVPDNFVKVIVDKTENAQLAEGEKQTHVFWVNPEKTVTIPAGTPTGKDMGQFEYIFTGWNHNLTAQFTTATTITAQYDQKKYDPDVITGVVATDLKVQPPLKDYADEIQSKEPFRVLRVVAQPDVSEPGMKMAKVEIQFRNGVKKIVDVRVYVKPDPKIIEKPVPGECNNSCDQPNVGKDALNTTDHYQYLIGYPDGNFGPNKGMTRAEAATMFTRLLRQRPVKGQRYNAGLNDIHAGDWYANTVGYAVQRGIVSGYPDGSFKPNKPITRAEFAAIASRFDALAQGNDIAFSDLAPSHWGYASIRSAATKGWISGYPDNTFRPEQAITRAEVTAIANRMLNRHADLYWIDAHPGEVIRFGDVKRSDWYFEPIMEATMGHDFIRDRDKKTEHWTGINGKSFI